MPDLLPADDLRLLFVGINPGLWTAAVQTHFAHPANRFYPALLRAGIVTEPVEPSAGMTDADRDRFRARGLGITNLVAGATARAAELRAEELREGGERLRALVARAPAAGGRGPRHHGVPPGLRAPEGRARAARTSRSRAPSCGWCPTRAG